ncbi:putative zinc finger A20 and AN1 domain-containing stress-associated protein 8 [Rhodamnia argentea]|uniref:Zinc finger A20 and AN1 domain-containing stress-associated protein 8 n=1 Tax=Rhodamnia argentea TaxID=178133 RepID=A0A8B8Q5D0_9MYRT|nr:putative zinc finger A20 and AN1 domain-containing stress-associated protein 8 [Rhodamnia argentea]
MGTDRDFGAEPSFCAAGCGFYGVREQHDLCSKCYATFLRDQVAKSAAEAPTGQASNSASEVAVSLDDLTALVSDLTIDGSTPRTIKKQNRCSACNKRVGLLGFECRCGDVFCGAHRYPEEHDCNVDFKVAARRRIAEEDPLCKADKMGFSI